MGKSKIANIIIFLLALLIVSAAAAGVAYAINNQEIEYEAIVTEPTCTEQGYTTYVSVDGETSYIDDYVPALGHDYVDEVTEPRCETQGYTLHTCTRCGYSYKDNYVEATGHDYSTSVYAPTCTTNGYTIYTCNNCIVAYRGDFIDALGHTYEFSGCTWAEDYTTATAAFTCSVCGYETTESATLSSEITVTQTATTDGEIVYTATITFEDKEYTDTKTEVIPAGTGYTKVVTAATCTQQGYTTYTSADGSDIYVTDYTEPLGHLLMYSGSQSATCTLDGYSIYLCERCEQYFYYDYVEATGHDFSDGETCSVCGLSNENYVELSQSEVLYGYTARFTSAREYIVLSYTLQSFDIAAYWTFTLKYVNAEDDNYVSAAIYIDGEYVARLTNIWYTYYEEPTLTYTHSTMITTGSEIEIYLVYYGSGSNTCLLDFSRSQSYEAGTEDEEDTDETTYTITGSISAADNISAYTCTYTFAGSSVEDKASENDAVTMYINLSGDVVVSYVEVINDTTGESFNASCVTANSVYNFIMPASNATVKVHLCNSSDYTAHTVTVDVRYTNDKVFFYTESPSGSDIEYEITATEAYEGDFIYVTVYGSYDPNIEDIQVSYYNLSTYESILATAIQDNYTYVFEMPASDITLFIFVIETAE